MCGVKTGTAILLMVLAAACSGGGGGQPPLTTIIVVRHAERATQAQDTPLSPAGAARANELAHVLAGVKLSVIYVTQFLRTQQTAEPTASSEGMQLTVFKTGSGYPRALVHEILTKHSGETVLVVTHGDTIAAILGELGIQHAPIPASEYDDLFVCSVYGKPPAQLLPLRYGAPAR